MIGSPPRILVLWSAPRCRSTAFFRMMLERGDFHVLHEPFSYLAEFGHSDVDGQRNRTQSALIESIRSRAIKHPVFFKDTTDERYPAVLDDTDFLGRQAVHGFLIRHPALTVPSYQRINPNATIEQIGFGHLHELFTAVTAARGEEPPVIDAEDLVANPEGIVEAFCRAVGIEFKPQALQWQAGARLEWSPSGRWHEDVSRSNGFQANNSDPADLPVSDGPTRSCYVAHHLPFFTDLYRRRLVARSAV